MSSENASGTGLATMRGRNYPSIRQFTVFLENRVGQLLEVVRRFEGSKVRIVALSIVNDTAECAFVRFLLSHPEQGREILERAGLAIIESDLIGVELPAGRTGAAANLHRPVAGRGEHRPGLSAAGPAPRPAGRGPDGRQHRDGPGDARRQGLHHDHRSRPGQRRRRLNSHSRSDSGNRLRQRN